MAVNGPAVSDRAVRVLPLDRAAAEALAEQIVALESDLAWAAWSVEQVLAPREGKWQLSAAALAGDVVVGASIASRPDAGTVHLHRLVVAAEARGRGIGAMLVRDLGHRAVAAGADRLTVKVEATNAQALRFYQRLGFQRVEEVEDLWLLSTPTAALVQGGPS